MPRNAGLKQGTAEALPFRDGWFHAAVCWLTIHLMDRPRAFADIARVLAPGGRPRECATFDPDYFDGFWLNRLFPSMEAADRARFPDPKEAGARPRRRGPRAGAWSALPRPARSPATTPWRRSGGRHISTFQLIPDDEYTGRPRARGTGSLPERVDYTVKWLLADGRARLSAPRPLPRLLGGGRGQRTRAVRFQLRRRGWMRPSTWYVTPPSWIALKK